MRIIHHAWHRSDNILKLLCWSKRYLHVVQRQILLKIMASVICMAIRLKAKNISFTILFELMMNVPRVQHLL